MQPRSFQKSIACLTLFFLTSTLVPAETLASVNTAQENRVIASKPIDSEQVISVTPAFSPKRVQVPESTPFLMDQPAVKKSEEKTRSAQEARRKSEIKNVYPQENLQAAMDQAKAGDTLFLHNGEYHGQFILKEGVNLIGEDPVKTIIHGDFKTRSNVITAKGNNKVEGLTITGGGAYDSMPSSALRIEGTNVIVRNNIFSENRDYAVHVAAEGIVLIEGNQFIKNHLAVQLPKDGTVIRSNHFFQNDLGVNILFGTQPLIENNEFLEQAFGSIYEYAAGKSKTRGHAIVRNNLFQKNTEKGSYYGSALPPAVEEQKSGNRILKLGETFYRSTKIWPAPENQWYVFQPESLGIDHQGNLYSVEGSIKKFSPDGTFLYEINEYNFVETNPCLACRPSHIAFDDQDNFYVTDEVGVKKFSSEGHFLLSFELPQALFSKTIRTYDIETDQQGFVYVTDINNRLIHQFDSQGRYLKSLGDHFFINSQSRLRLEIDSKGIIYVADSHDFSIHRFDAQGNHLSKWYWQKSTDQRISDMIFMMDSQDSLYIGHHGMGFLKKFNTQGVDITPLWDDPNWFDKENRYAFVDGAVTGDIDQTGNIYLVGDRTVEVFDVKGRHLETHGSYTKNPSEGFFWPVGMTLSSDGTLYVRDENYSIFSFDPQGNHTKTWTLPHDLLPYPLAGNGMAVSKEGHVFLSQKNILMELDNQGKVLYSMNIPGHDYLGALNIDAEGFLWIKTDVGKLIQWNIQEKRIVKEFDLMEMTKQVKTSGIFAQGFYLDPKGRIIIVNREAGVFVFDFQGALVKGFPLVSPRGLPYGYNYSAWTTLVTSDENGNIYVLFEEYGEIHKYDSNGNFLTSWGTIGTLPGQMMRPEFLGIYPNGDFVIVEHGNNRIQIFSLGEN